MNKFLLTLALICIPYLASSVIVIKNVPYDDATGEVYTNIPCNTEITNVVVTSTTVTNSVETTYDPNHYSPIYVGGNEYNVLNDQLTINNGTVPPPQEKWVKTSIYQQDIMTFDWNAKHCVVTNEVGISTNVVHLREQMNWGVVTN